MGREVKLQQLERGVTVMLPIDSSALYPVCLPLNL